MERIGFVIVQYNNDKDTIICIESIKKTMKNHDYKICIVDNKSINNAYENMKSYFKNDSFVTVIEANSNLGYAKGGNLGVLSLLNQYNADLVCVLNNDIIFNVADLYQLINEINQPYDLLAPNISQANGVYQNPQPEIKYTLFWINLYIIVYYCLMVLHKIHLDVIFYILAVLTMGKVYSKGKKAENERRYITKLHGSCMFFTRNYLEYFNRQAMHPDTFLFLEEDFLALRCKKEKKTILYDSQIEVIHLEDKATNLVCKNMRNKRLFLYKNHIQSFKKFKHYFLEVNENSSMLKN